VEREEEEKGRGGKVKGKKVSNCLASFRDWNAPSAAMYIARTWRTLGALDERISEQRRLMSSD
jgi:hypothetical protein